MRYLRSLYLFAYFYTNRFSQEIELEKYDEIDYCLLSIGDNHIVTNCQK